jgi:hypothetical protein
MSGKVTIQGPTLLPQCFTWQADSQTKQASSYAIRLAEARAPISVRSSTGGSQGAVIACLAQYAVGGFLKPEADALLFAKASMFAIREITGWTELVIVLNEHRQVVRIEPPSVTLQ